MNNKTFLTEPESPGSCGRTAPVPTAVHRRGVGSVIRQLRTLHAGDQVADRSVHEQAFLIGDLTDIRDETTSVSALCVDRHNPTKLR
jgi:hypothetical protein